MARAEAPRIAEVLPNQRLLYYTVIAPNGDSIVGRAAKYLQVMDALGKDAFYSNQTLFDNLPVQGPTERHNIAVSLDILGSRLQGTGIAVEKKKVIARTQPYVSNVYALHYKDGIDAHTDTIVISTNLRRHKKNKQKDDEPFKEKEYRVTTFTDKRTRKTKPFRLTLPNGVQITGDEAKVLLYLAHRRDPHTAASWSEMMANIFPDRNPQEKTNFLQRLIRDIRENSEDFGIYVESVIPYTAQRRAWAPERAYYLELNNQIKAFVEAQLAPYTKKVRIHEAVERKSVHLPMKKHDGVTLHGTSAALFRLMLEHTGTGHALTGKQLMNIIWPEYPYDAKKFHNLVRATFMRNRTAGIKFVTNADSEKNEHNKSINTYYLEVDDELEGFYHSKLRTFLTNEARKQTQEAEFPLTIESSLDRMKATGIFKGLDETLTDQIITALFTHGITHPKKEAEVVDENKFRAFAALCHQFIEITSTNSQLWEDMTSGAIQDMDDVLEFISLAPVIAKTKTALADCDMIAESTLVDGSRIGRLRINENVAERRFRINPEKKAQRLLEGLNGIDNKNWEFLTSVQIDDIASILADIQKTSPGKPTGEFNIQTLSMNVIKPNETIATNQLTDDQILDRKRAVVDACMFVYRYLVWQNKDIIMPFQHIHHDLSYREFEAALQYTQRTMAKIQEVRDEKANGNGSNPVTLIQTVEGFARALLAA